MGSVAATGGALRPAGLFARTLPWVLPGVELRSWSSAAELSGRNLNLQPTPEAGKLKSIDDLPGPSFSTTLYWLFFRGYADKSHLLQVCALTPRCGFTIVLFIVADLTSQELK